MGFSSRVFRVVAFCALTLSAVAAGPVPEPDKDGQLPMLLQEARELLTAKDPEAAIKKCDAVIGRYAAHYKPDGEQKFYCARSESEVLFYLLKKAGEADRGDAKPGKQSVARVLSSTWADAYFTRAYALIELRRVADAKTALQRALELSPANARYLSELGMVYQVEKNWAESSKQYQAAIENAGVSPKESQASELARARRGLAYNFVELGKLDEAERIYLQCLATDPNDHRAENELKYVRVVKAKMSKE